VAKRKKAKDSKVDRWPKIRAAIIAYVILFNVIAAIPSPGTINEETLARPTNQAELHRWVALFSAIGIETTPESLGEWYVGFAGDLTRAHRIAITPIEPWLAFTQTWQGWRLFGMPDERPYALELSVERDGKPEVIYLSGDSERTAYASLLEYRRVRAMYNPGHRGPPVTYRGFGKRLSERIFDDMPDVDRVTLTLIQSHTTLPGEPPDPETRRAYPLTFTRGVR
jgi:hypothetical protein